ncbi:MAG: rhombosortase [Opitutaceae bacterium]|nr:rhombosortase [Opitutaceae bacterium]
MKSVRPVLLAAAPALLGLVPAVREVLLYDRTAILQGEWWRLWTGHWMHFTASHLTWNLLVLAGAGWWLERVQPGSLLRYLAVAAPMLGVSFLAGAPGMGTYGGLSGLATGVVVLLALAQLGRDRAARAWWLGLLALVALKLALDAAQPAPLFASFGAQVVRVSTFAHVMGAITAVGFFLSRRLGWRDELRRPAAAHAQ